MLLVIALLVICFYLAIGLPIWLAFRGAYVPRWAAFVPVWQTVALLRVARMSTGWTALCFVAAPILVPLHGYALSRVFEYEGMPSWYGWLAVIPIVAIVGALVIVA